MTLAAAIQGALRPSQAITWTDADGAAVDLSGATITARLRNLSSGAVAASAGTFTLVNPTAGQFRWDYAASDVGLAGEFEVQFSAEFGSAPTPARTVVAAWSVLRSI